MCVINTVEYWHRGVANNLNNLITKTRAPISPLFVLFVRTIKRVVSAIMHSTVYYSSFSSLPIHCKKELAVFPSPAGMSLIKLFLGGNNLVFSCPERVWSVTSRLGMGKWLTLFYSVSLAISEAAVNFLWCISSA
jgi:hypothetical protein